MSNIRFVKSVVELKTYTKYLDDSKPVVDQNLPSISSFSNEIFFQSKMCLKPLCFTETKLLLNFNSTEQQHKKLLD